MRSILFSALWLATASAHAYVETLAVNPVAPAGSFQATVSGFLANNGYSLVSGPTLTVNGMTLIVDFDVVQLPVNALEETIPFQFTLPLGALVSGSYLLQSRFEVDFLPDFFPFAEDGVFMTDLHFEIRGNRVVGVPEPDLAALGLAGLAALAWARRRHAGMRRPNPASPA